jgi:hypothetical protein
MEALYRVRACAHESVGKACAFAGLAITVTMVGLSFDLALSAQTGGALTTLLSLVLTWHAVEAPRKPYRRTEVWLLLGRRLDMPEIQAQRIIATELRDAYAKFAKITGLTGLALWGGGLLLGLLAGNQQQ